MARRPLFHLLPQNLEIHNLTSLQLTDRQSKVLGMGLKFRPSLPTQMLLSLTCRSDFCRRVCLQHKFANCLQDPDFNPRLYIPTGWNPPRENPDLGDKLFAVRQEPHESIAVNIPHWKNNLTKQEREELQELKSNPHIKVLPTDKNLGSSLLSTDWSQNPCPVHSQFVFTLTVSCSFSLAEYERTERGSPKTQNPESRFQSPC